jgi:hypothetical protein
MIMHQLRTQYLCLGQQPRCQSRFKTKTKTGFKAEFKTKPIIGLL